MATPLTIKCQVVDPEHDELFCSWEVSPGYRCEAQPPEADRAHAHFLSDHTIEHDLAGNGYTCESMVVGLPLRPRR